MNQLRIGSMALISAIFLSAMHPIIIFGQPCKEWVAKAASVQGSVEILRAGEKQWQSVKLNDTLCSGDTVRIMKQSRADIVLGNKTVLRLNQNTTISFPEAKKEMPFPLNLLNGSAYFFSHARRVLKVFTPFVNAIIEGTEFYARVEDNKTFLTIFEGRVALTNESGTITLAKGQSAVAEMNRAPVVQVVLRPRDAVQWTLYYAPVLDYRLSDLRAPTGWQDALRRSIEAYLEGNIQKALDILDSVTEEINDPRFFTYRASLLLSIGRVDEARSDIEKALSISPNQSEALALQAVIALAQNERDKALSLAMRAVEADSQSVSARIALSYALQADFKLEAALQTLEQAVKLGPENALAWARLSEIWLSLGYLDKALQAAKRAAELSPQLSRTQTILGFAYLAQVKIKMSKIAFEKAIEFDQADPLPRLGLGLAIIRDGHLAAGREEIEIAASLAPDNSLIRSYLGKAFYEERREKLAANQFAAAKELDPSDPTPFFYDAILKQSINRPVEALYDIQKSIELNDNRAVYRSRLLLDSDLAARSASLGRIYNDLGFQQIALVEGWKSVNTDPANFSTHRFLADSYSALPRHQVAGVSELLQSQLLQPININPVQPHLADKNLLILNGAGLGPSQPSLDEFNPLFNRNRLALQLSGIAGTQNTWGDEVVQSGVWGPFSYSLGQFYYQTDGIRDNNDLKKNIYNIFVQGMLSYNLSMMAEFRSTNTKYGDPQLRFFHEDFLPNLRNSEDTWSARFGFNYAFSPRSNIIGTFAFGNLEFKLRDLPIPILAVADQFDENSYGGELQHLFRTRYINTVAGAGYFKMDTKDSFLAQLTFLPPGVPQVTRSHPYKANLYLYSYINYPKDFIFTIAGSGDFFRGAIKDRDQFNPKFGVMWNPFPSTTVRAAIFRVLTKSLVTFQTIDQTLEPTQVAGFNQFFDDNPGTDSWRFGIAVDQKFLTNLYGGIEFSGRNLDVPYFFSALPAATVVRTAEWEELLGRIYLYWTPHPWFGLSVECQYEKLDRDRADQSDPLGIRNLRTFRVPLGINFYHPSGFSAGITATYINQDGNFHLQNTAPGVFRSGEGQFWSFDAFINYRLPKRFGLITFGAKNLFNRSFNYQDSDPLNPTTKPKRFIYGKVTLTY